MYPSKQANVPLGQGCTTCGRTATCGLR